MPATERSLGQLVTDAVGDVRTIVQYEKALLKAELAAAAKAGGVGAGLLAAAASLVGLGSIFLLIAAAEALIAADLPRWAGFLIVGGALVVLALVLGGIGAVFLKRVRGPKQTTESAQAVAADVRGSLAKARPSAASVEAAKATAVVTAGSRTAGQHD